MYTQKKGSVHYEYATETYIYIHVYISCLHPLAAFVGRSGGGGDPTMFCNVPAETSYFSVMKFPSCQSFVVMLENQEIEP